jgi:Fur family ferric uptake transcriptional regulator
MSMATNADWVKHALETLADAGYRKGGARSAVVELLGRQSCALTARDIDDRLHSGGNTVGRASVYRTLETLTDLKLVTKLELGRGEAHYEPSLPSGEHHHHLVCDRCGRVTPFEDPELERTLAKLCQRVSYTVDEHDVVLHGQCRDCVAA